MSNTFGNIFKLTTFGESHGPGIGGIIDGMPAGITVDLDFYNLNSTADVPDKVHLPPTAKRPTR